MSQKIEVVPAGFMAVTHGHGLNKAQGEIIPPAIFRHVHEFIVIDALKGQHVDLDRVEPGVTRRRETGERIGQRPAPGDARDTAGSRNNPGCTGSSRTGARIRCGGRMN
ncbi:MAG TPA: hypothetical protein VFU39_07590 [Sulfuricaulis sp.]|nr:hypothetical protein [Sulfuricaulis sp.]